MPRGALAQYLCTFLGQKENFTVYSSGKKAIIIKSKQGTTIFFSHYNLFLGKLREKLVQKAPINIDRVYRIRLMTPGHPMILLKSN